MIDSAGEQSTGRLMAPSWRCLLLCLCSAIATAVLAPVAMGLAGNMGLLALAVAALACVGGAVCGELASLAFSRPEEALLRLLLSMLCRLFIPMAVLVVVVVRGPALLAAGAAYYFIVQYLLMLAIEAWLSVQQVRAGEEK
jgi:hypothetical protein